MTGQEEIPVDETLPESGPCAWCGKGTRLKLTLQPARFSVDKRTGVRVCKRPERWAWICSAHKASVRLSKDDGGE